MAKDKNILGDETVVETPETKETVTPEVVASKSTEVDDKKEIKALKKQLKLAKEKIVLAENESAGSSDRSKENIIKTIPTASGATITVYGKKKRK